MCLPVKTSKNRVQVHTTSASLCSGGPLCRVSDTARGAGCGLLRRSRVVSPTAVARGSRLRPTLAVPPALPIPAGFWRRASHAARGPMPPARKFHIEELSKGKLLLSWLLARAWPDWGLSNSPTVAMSRMCAPFGIQKWLGPGLSVCLVGCVVGWLLCLSACCVSHLHLSLRSMTTLSGVNGRLSHTSPKPFEDSRAMHSFLSILVALIVVAGVFAPSRAQPIATGAVFVIYGSVGLNSGVVALSHCAIDCALYAFCVLVCYARTNEPRLGMLLGSCFVIVPKPPGDLSASVGI